MTRSGEIASCMSGGVARQAGAGFTFKDHRKNTGWKTPGFGQETRGLPSGGMPSSTRVRCGGERDTTLYSNGRLEEMVVIGLLENRLIGGCISEMVLAIARKPILSVFLAGARAVR